MKRLAIIAAAALAVGGAQAQTRWDMPTPYSEGEFHTRNVKAFAEDVQKATGGKLAIQVKGLVFPDDPRVPAELRGINDESEFRALVSCVTVNEAGTAMVEENIITDGFPANAKGNAKLKTTIALPQPCLAPIIMILAGDVDAWFTITGF